MHARAREAHSHPLAGGPCHVLDGCFELLVAEEGGQLAEPLAREVGEPVFGPHQDVQRLAGRGLRGDVGPKLADGAAQDVHRAGADHQVGVGLCPGVGEVESVHAGREVAGVLVAAGRRGLRPVKDGELVEGADRPRLDAAAAARRVAYGDGEGGAGSEPCVGGREHERAWLLVGARGDGRAVLGPDRQVALGLGAVGLGAREGRLVVPSAEELKLEGRACGDVVREAEGQLPGPLLAREGE